MTNVFIVSEADDIGGVAAAIVRANERHGSAFDVTAMRGSNNYIDYPEIRPWDPAVFFELYRWADIIHGMEKLANVETVIGHPLDKPAILHHHGSQLRDDPRQAERAAKRGWKQLCSTLDLTLIDERIEWLPNPIHLEWVAGFRRQYAPTSGAPFIVSHIPTQRHIKGTEIFEAAAKQAGVRTLLMEYVPWVQSLVGKARSHAYFDQLAFGFGLSALEAWAMGLPVLAGVASPLVRDKMVFTWGVLPFIDVNNRNEIALALRHLADSPQYRHEAAMVGVEYVHEYHDAGSVLRELERIWGEVLDNGRPSV